MISVSFEPINQRNAATQIKFVRVWFAGMFSERVACAAIDSRDLDRICSWGCENIFPRIWNQFNSDVESPIGLTRPLSVCAIPCTLELPYHLLCEKGAKINTPVSGSFTTSGKIGMISFWVTFHPFAGDYLYDDADAKISAVLETAMDDVGSGESVPQIIHEYDQLLISSV